MKKRLLFLLLPLVWGMGGYALGASRSFVIDSLALLRADSLVRRSEAKGEGRYSFALRDVTLGASSAVGYEPKRLLTPASVTKLFTSMAVLTKLGADYAYATDIRLEGHVQEGVLHGNLVIIGSGDPSINSKYFTQDKERWQRSLLQAVRSVGIHRIEGNIVVDASRFDRVGIHPRWASEDRGDYYGTGVFGFNLYDNWLDLFFSTGKTKESITLVDAYPPEPGIALDNQLTVSCKTQGWEGVGNNLSELRTLLGILPCNKSRVRVAIDLPHPPLYAARLIRRMLREEGAIEVSGQAEVRFDAPTKPKGRLIGRYYSPPLRDLCREMNYQSLNHYAEAFFKSLVPTVQASYEEAWQAEQRICRELGITLSSGARLYDGSGLTRANRLAAQDLVEMLVAISNNADVQMLDAFVSSIPRAGREGTVRNFMKDSRLKLLLKSGSMSGVQTYAGYLYHGGRTYAVALLANGVTNRSAVRGVMQRYLETLFLP